MFEKYSNSFLKDFNFDSLLEKFSQKKFLTFKKNEIIFSENNEITDLYFILSGEINLCRKRNENEYELISTVHSGDIIGFCDALTNKKYSNTAIAVSDVNTFAVNKNELDEITKKNDEFNLWVLKYLSNRINQTE